MNDTAKKLREAAGCEYASVWNMISALRGRMGIEERDTYNNDLSAILTAIADELDELEAKADRRRKHIGHLESTIAERNRELRERAARLEREVERCHKLIDMMDMASAKERRIPKTKRGEHGED